MKKATTKNKSYGSAAIYILWFVSASIIDILVSLCQHY
jgi:hypothetical protein